MRTLLILGLCATAMVANAQTAKTEIVNKYYIDGEPVYDFNGSQLNGKTIVKYKVDTMPPLPFDPDKVIIIHHIETSDYKAPESPTAKVFVPKDDQFYLSESSLLATSEVSSAEPNVLKRKNPSPHSPNPTPGVPMI